MATILAKRKTGGGWTKCDGTAIPSDRTWMENGNTGTCPDGKTGYYITDNTRLAMSPRPGCGIHIHLHLHTCGCGCDPDHDEEEGDDHSGHVLNIAAKPRSSRSKTR